jgi:hypothetical protein
MNFLRIMAFVLLAQGATNPSLTTNTSIQGNVARIDSGEPLSDVAVVIRRTDGLFERSNTQPSYTAKTAEDGAFVFKNIEPGQYRVSATRQGYVYGQGGTSGPGLTITISAGQMITNVHLALVSAGVIVGRIADHNGDPVDHAQVQASKTSYSAGRRKLVEVQSVPTNDLGDYRLFGLPPGQYYISATPLESSKKSSKANGGDEIQAVITTNGALTMVSSATSRTASSIPSTSDSQSFPTIRRILKDGGTAEEANLPVYFPGTTDVQAAKSLDLPAGGVLGGINFVMEPVRVRHISGRVTTNDSTHLGPVSITLVPRNPSVEDHTPPKVTADETTGTFELSGVQRGSYSLLASSATMFGRVAVQVDDADLENVPVAMTPGFTLSGKVNIENLDPKALNAKSASLDAVLLSADPQVPGLSGGASGRVESDGSFVIIGVMPGSYQAGVAYHTIPGEPPLLLYSKSARLGSADVLGGLLLEIQPQEQLEIVMGVRPGSIEGVAINQKRSELANITVVAVPEKIYRRRTGLYKRVSTDPAGRFQIQGLRPGEYKVFAWEEVEKDAWLDPDFLSVYEDRATVVHVREGVSVTVEPIVISR